jgi:hypothetical protein
MLPRIYLRRNFEHGTKPGDEEINIEKEIENLCRTLTERKYQPNFTFAVEMYTLVFCNISHCYQTGIYYLTRG